MQDGWFSKDSRHVRLILPRFATDRRITRRREQLQWLHTTESLRRVKKKVVSEEWAVQAVTISFTGGRWQASFSVRQWNDKLPHGERCLPTSAGEGDRHGLDGPFLGHDLLLDAAKRLGCMQPLELFTTSRNPTVRSEARQNEPHVP